MIIEQITLSNWLSYPAKWEQNGQLVEPHFRFDQEQVYLIFGKNGAGKSSIMEAILFALFGNYSRASYRQDVKREGAIRAGEKTAMVELVFSLNGQRHRVKRILKTKTTNAHYSSWDEKNTQWIDGLSQVKPVNDKIEELLGMNQDLFCGTVILEQGNTGRFMELNPGDQVDHVTKLLGLNIYSLYYEKAKELANQRKRDVKTIEDELINLFDTTIETMQHAETGVQSLQDVLSQIESDLQSLDQYLNKVQLVEGLRRDLGNVTQKIEQFEKQLTGKKEIEKADQIVQDWKQVEPLLGVVQQAQKHFTGQQKRMDELQNELSSNQQRLLENQTLLDVKLQPGYDKSEITLKETRKSLEAQREKLVEAKEQRDLISSELDLDTRQNEIRDQQQDRQQILQDFPQVKTNYQLWTELNRVVPKLESLVSEFLDSEHSANEIAELQQSLSEELEALSERRITLNQLKEQSEILGADFDATKTREEKIRNDLNTNKTTLEKREEAHGESICPTCGTSLEGELLDRFHQELNELRKIVSEGKSTLKEAHQKTQELEEKAKAIDKQLRQEEKAIDGEDSRLAAEQKNLESGKIRIEHQEREAHTQWEELKISLSHSMHIVTGPTTECLEFAREQLGAISDIQKRYNGLIQTQAAFESAQEELKRVQGQQQHALGTFSQIQLDEAGNIVIELNNEVKQTEKNLQAEESKERELFQLLTNTKSQLNALVERIQAIEQNLLPQEQKSLNESGLHKQSTFQRFDEHVATLEWPARHLQILRTAADNDQQAEQEIHAWVDEQRPIAEQISELRKAENQIGELRSKYSTLDEQIKAFPDDVKHGQSENIESELQGKRQEKTDAKVELELWQKKVWEETEKLSRKQEFQKKHESLIAEERDFRELATLLEPPGTRSSSVGGPLLQAIMRESLKQVAKRASNILDEWGQSTQIIIPQDALEFKVIDLASGNSERHYQLFSGGEKFMVALAMALAIGEVASDTGHTDCLFIDEGFGLLDKDNRAYVAQEIVNKLVSSGRRKQVIVITHMEDIQGAFADSRSRYHLVNDGTATRLFVGDAYASS